MMKQVVKKRHLFLNGQNTFLYFQSTDAKVKVIRPPYVVDRLQVVDITRDSTGGSGHHSSHHSGGSGNGGLLAVVYLNEYNTVSAAFTLHSNESKVIRVRRATASITVRMNVKMSFNSVYVDSINHILKCTNLISGLEGANQKSQRVVRRGESSFCVANRPLLPFILWRWGK